MNNCILIMLFGGPQSYQALREELSGDVENYLTYKCNPVSNKLLEYIFPGVDPSRINSINRGKSNRDFKGVIEFNFWDGKQFEINIPLDT